MEHPLCTGHLRTVSSFHRYDDRAAMIRRQDEELDAEQLEAYVQQRFGNQRDAAAEFGDGIEAGAYPQPGLGPAQPL